MTSSFFARYRKSILATLVFSFIAACDPGGCSSCAGCGVTPIPGGFPLARRIPNAGQVRLTQSGIGFVEDNLGPIVESMFPDGLTFPIPTTSASGAIICPQAGDCDDCGDHACNVTIDIMSAQIDSVDPNILRTTLRVNIETDGLDLFYDSSAPCAWFQDGPLCDVSMDTGASPPADQGFGADIVFTTESRTGYTKVEVVNAALTEDLQSGDIDISGANGCGDVWCAIANFDFIKDLIIGQLQDQLASNLTGPIQDALCRTCIDDSQCVSGMSACVDGVCEWNDDGSCVPWLLGTEGRIDLGGLLASITPGLTGNAQFTFASGGEGEADGDGTDGLNLNFMGGFDSLAHNECVPALTPPDIPSIPLSDDIRSDTIPAGGDSMVNVGIAESYLNFASFGIFDSGMLCIGATPRLSQQLETGLFSLAIPSLEATSFPSEHAPVAMQLRPQTPPAITVGEDPLLSVLLDDLNIDFYVFSRDRWVRFMTVALDMTINLNLTVDAEGLLPEIESVTTENVAVTNSRLLYQDAGDVADVFGELVGLATDLFLGTLNPFALPDLLGFTLEIPAGGITMTESSGERFLSIFANLSFDAAAAGAQTFAPETSAVLDRLDVDPSAFDLGEGWRDKRPVAHLSFDAAAPGDVEWSYRIDGGTWSAWSAEPTVALAAPHFMFQGRHEVEVRSRMAGQRLTADPTPAVVEILVDTRAPSLELEATESGFVATASDIVSSREALEYAWKVGDEPWTGWGDSAEMPADPDAAVTVRVRDEAGNVTEATSGEAAAGIIRGGPSTTGEAACSCRTTSGGSPGAAGWLLFGLVAVAILRRRGARALLAVLLPFSLFTAGCDCGGSNGTGDDSDAGTGCEACTDGQVCCEADATCVDVPVLACEPGFECADDVEALFDAETCAFPATCENCVELPPLDPGILGSYTDFAQAGDGTVWVSGYAEGDVEGGADDAWGDLVVGVYQSESSDVGWQVVDGVPAGAEIVGAVTGWRGGIEEPGDDVGRYTSIALDAAGAPRVTYWDATNGDLKFAALVGADWQIQVVEEEGEVGKWSSLAVLGGDVPAATYVQVRSDPAVAGGFLSALRFARGDQAVPTGWDVADVAVQPIPCRPQWCGDGEVCTESGVCAVETADCGDCGSGNACVAGACTAILEDPYIEDWQPGFVHSSLAIDPTTSLPVVAFYDRSQGNAMLASFDGVAWSPPAIVDGFDGLVDTCDCGLSISLFVDTAGARHTTYIDGWTEALVYRSSTSGREVVDVRGAGLLGDDSSIVVTDAGEARVAYQDSTDGTLKYAVRTAPGAWTVSTLDVLPSAGAFGGFHVEQMWDGAASRIGSWWIDHQESPIVAGVLVVTP